MYPQPVYMICPESYRIRRNYAAVRAITPFKVIQGHRVWYQSKAHMRLPNVINTNLAPMLQRFRDIAFERYKIAIFGYPSCVQLQTEEFSWDDLRKIIIERSEMAKVPNGIETLPEISIGSGCTNITDRQTTDDRLTDVRTTAYSEREREFAKNGI